MNYCQASELLLLHKVYIRYLWVTEGTASVTIWLSTVSVSEILIHMPTLFGNRVCSLKDVVFIWVAILKAVEGTLEQNIFYLFGLLFHGLTLLPIA